MKRLSDNPAAAPVALALFVVVGALIRYSVAGQDLFADELATYWVVSTNGLAGVVDTVSTTAEITPPLGFMLTWLTSRIDLTPELIRLPALVAGIGSIPLVYLLGARTVGRGAGLLAAALTALGPFMIFYSAEARGYGVMMALVLLSTLALLVAIDDGRRRWWVAFVALVALAAYTHYTSIFVLAGQFAWALWAHPAARRPLLIATGAAALLYIPWLSGFRGDLNSPTTEILGALSPFDLSSIKLYLGHWTLGFPFANVGGLRDLPGVPGLLLIAAAVAVGAAGLWRARAGLRAWFAANDDRILLVAVLALATPVGEAIASLLSTNVFSTRNLAASWPYLALTGAALITVGDRRLRLAAATLAVAGFGFGAVQMLDSDYERPPFSEVAAYVADGPGGVVVDAAAVTPGPLANFDVEGSDPGGEVLRLNIPEQQSEPFDFGERPPDPGELAQRAVVDADGGPITVVSPVGPAARVERPADPDLAAAFIAALPPSYDLTERRLFEGLVDLQAQTFEQGARAGA